nr:envelope protein E1 [Hepacivirus P]
FTPLTNCCNDSQVVYCTEMTCVHDSGCVICQEDFCWEPQGPLVSRHPNYTGVDPFLTHHIDFVAGVIFVCDLINMHEFCGGVTLVSSLVLDALPKPITLNQTGDCYLEIYSGVDPGFWGFLGWLASEAQALAAVAEFILKVPAAIAHAVTENHFLAMASIAGLAMNGNVPKALALVVLYVESAVA